MGAEIGHGGRGLPMKLIELAERAGQHNFADGGCDAFADRRKPSQVGSLPDHLIETFREGTDARSGAAIRLHLIRIFFLRRKQLREACEPIRDFPVAQPLRLLLPSRFSVSVHRSPAIARLG